MYLLLKMDSWIIFVLIMDNFESVVGGWVVVILMWIFLYLVMVVL